jgi:hypothetical protein
VITGLPQRVDGDCGGVFVMTVMMVVHVAHGEMVTMTVCIAASMTS